MVSIMGVYKNTQPSATIVVMEAIGYCTPYWLCITHGGYIAGINMKIYCIVHATIAVCIHHQLGIPNYFGNQFS